MSLFPIFDLQVEEAQDEAETSFQRHIPFEYAQSLGAALLEFKENDWDKALKSLGIYRGKMPNSMWDQIQSSAYEFAVPKLLQAAGFQIEKDTVNPNRFGDLIDEGFARVELKTAGLQWDAKTPKTAYDWSLGQNNHLDMPVIVITKSTYGLVPKNVEVLPLWGFLGPTADSPMKVHKKNKSLNNLRPVGRGSRFISRADAILAARKLGEHFDL